MTLRQILLMWDGWQDEQWAHTSTIQAAILSVAGGEWIDPDVFHPFREGSTAKGLAITCEDLRSQEFADALQMDHFSMAAHIDQDW